MHVCLSANRAPFFLPNGRRFQARKIRQPVQEQRSVLSISPLQHTIDHVTDADARVDAVTKLQAEFERGIQVTTTFFLHLMTGV